MEINLKNICAINKYAASTEETRYYLNGVFIHTDVDWVYAVATDGHRLIVHRFPNVDKEDFKFIIPRVFLSSFKFSARDDGMAQLFYSDKTIIVSRNGEDRSVKEVDGTFPDYARVISGNRELAPSVFNGQHCADFDSLGRAFGVGGAVINPCGANPAIVTFRGRDDLYGVIMPIPSKNWEFSERAPF